MIVPHNDRTLATQFLAVRICPRLKAWVAPLLAHPPEIANPIVENHPAKTVRYNGLVTGKPFRLTESVKAAG